MTRTIRIGSGSAWWGDRVEPARLNAEQGALDYLCFETMAEATVSAAQVRARRDPSFPGYDTYLDDRMRAVLPGCMRQGTRIVSNQGWINPEGAARRIVELLRELGHHGVKVAAVGGSLITDRVLQLTDRILENGQPTASLAPTLISAEAYLGAEPIVEALKAGARIVVTGRVADPSIFMAPMMFEYGWDPLDHARLGMGNGIGHLLECGAQVTGGYFPDPGFKDVPEPWNLAFPIAEVAEDGSAVITKVAGSGGAVTLQTVKEQMLYEVHDPGAYLTPDVTADFRVVRIEDIAPDRISVSGATGRARPDQLKATIGLDGGFLAETEISYAGPGASARAELAKAVLEERMLNLHRCQDTIRYDFIGQNALLGTAGVSGSKSEDVRLRAAMRSREHIQQLVRDVQRLREIEHAISRLLR
jgi:hypothetical protein